MDDAVFVGSFLFYMLLSAVVCGVAGFLILNRVERSGTGALLGALLGPIGLVMAWVIRDNGIRDAEERERRHKSHADTRSATARSATPATVHPIGAQLQAELEALERLGRLREAGHITEEEFQAKKRQILGPVAAQVPVPQRPVRRFH